MSVHHLPTPDDYARLAALTSEEYDQARKDEARRFNISLKTLDAEVKKRRPRAARPERDRKPPTPLADILALDRFGGVISSVSNFITIMDADPVLTGMFGYDEFRCLRSLLRPPPSPAAPAPGPYPRAWAPSDVSCVQAYIQRIYAQTARKTDIEDAMTAVASFHRFHPVADWLASLQWDGIPRLDTWMIRAFGSPDTEYVRAVAAKFLIAAVRRVRRPGTKFDHMPILEGKQGIKKSTALMTLFSREWTTDSLPSNLDSRDAALGLQGVWAVEFAEIEQLIRTEVEVIKSFLSRPVDRFRAPYGRDFLEYPRQCVLAGTTNDNEYLRDPTGNRRFWPISCEFADVDLIRAERSQIWAEAAMREAAGEAIWLEEAELSTSATEVAASRLQHDVWEEEISRYVEFKTTTTTRDILVEALRLEPKDVSRYDQMRVAASMKGLGWVNKVRWLEKRATRVWQRDTPDEGVVGEGVRGL